MSGQHENLENRRKRLRYRAWHRGMREMDLLLGSFADAMLPDATGDRLNRFEVLIEAGDVELLSWITGRAAPDEECDKDMLSEISRFRAEGPDRG